MTKGLRCRKAYDVEHIERIYIHADGGKWIRNGLETFSNVVHVMDGYHFFKALKSVSRKYPHRNIKMTILNAIKKDDCEKAKEYIQELSEEDASIIEFGTYLLSHWEAIRNLVMLDIPGSCTEGQVSHILSERFSRNPMGWSKAGLGKLSKLRVYNINGGKLTGEKIKEQSKESYSEYADRFISDQIQKAEDWSIFEKENVIIDGPSGTQAIIRKYGREHGIL